MSLFSFCRKRYEKAEKEFVEAKMDLYRRAETKEKLTEHLYTIIYQNEMRKAQKLSELMEMLALTTSGEEVECILPAIPPIPMYNPVQTLYSPSKSAQATKDAEIGNHKSSDASKPETCDDQKGGDQSVGSDIPNETSESLSKGSASSVTPEKGKEKQTDTDTPGAANGDVPSSSQNSLPSETTEVKGAADPSVESEADKRDCKDKEHGASSGGCEISDNYSIPETAKISSSLQTNIDDERTKTDKKTTLKELAQ